MSNRAALYAAQPNAPGQRMPPVQNGMMDALSQSADDPMKRGLLRKLMESLGIVKPQQPMTPEAPMSEEDEWLNASF